MTIETEDNGPSLRDALTSAMETTEAPEVDAPVEAVEPVEAAPTEDAPEDKPGRSRDEGGRFAKGGKPALKPEAPVAAKPVAEAPVAPDATAAATPPVAAPASVKAPQSWKPAAREEWAKLSPAVQEEVARREREIATSMQQTAQVRQFQQAFQQTVSPYEAMIRAEGGDVMATVGSLLQTAAALRTAPAGHKAELVASVIRQFGVPIEALAAALDGQPAPQGQAQQQQHVDPRQLAQQVREEVMQSFQQQRSQVMQSKVASEIESFSQKSEFFSDVREDMADILEVASKRGLTMSYEEAYARACALHPEVSRVLEQRKAASQANATQASTQRAKAAASSVRSQPAGGVGAAQPDGLRDLLENAWSKHSGR